MLYLDEKKNRRILAKGVKLKMKNADRLEIKKRFKKDCTISRIAGCYVDCNKEKILKFNENFLNMPEEEFYKYLEIAKKSFSGAIGNNILELPFMKEQTENGKKQQFLRGLRESKLQNEELLELLYDMIIEKLQYTGNYIILVYHDSYDVMIKTSDNIKIDESEEVFEYILVSICPVDLTKAGLGYRADLNKIGARIRDWVLGAPDLAFMFPAFDDRSANIHCVDYYVKDPKAPHAEFIRDVLGCEQKRTAVQHRDVLKQVVKQTYGSDLKKADDILMGIQESINDMMEAREQEEGKLAAPIELDDNVINEILEDANVREEKAVQFKRVLKEEFADDIPHVDDLLDAKAVKANAPIKREKELLREVHELKGKLETSREKFRELGIPFDENAVSIDNFDKFEGAVNAADNLPDNTAEPDKQEAGMKLESIPDSNIYFSDEDVEAEYMDVLVHVGIDRADNVKTCMINNKRCLVIPLEDSDEMGIVVKE